MTPRKPKPFTIHTRVIAEVYTEEGDRYVLIQSAFALDRDDVERFQRWLEKARLWVAR